MERIYSLYVKLANDKLWVCSLRINYTVFVDYLYCDASTYAYFRARQSISAYIFDKQYCPFACTFVGIRITMEKKICRITLEFNGSYLQIVLPMDLSAGVHKLWFLYHKQNYEYKLIRYNAESNSYFYWVNKNLAVIAVVININTSLC